MNKEHRKSLKKLAPFQDEVNDVMIDSPLHKNKPETKKQQQKRQLMEQVKQQFIDLSSNSDDDDDGSNKHRK